MDSWEILKQVAEDGTQEPLQMSVVGIQSENVGCIIGFSQEIERPVESFDLS